MHRLLAILALLLAASLARGADEAAAPMPILPLFKAKDKISYEVTQWRTDSTTNAEPAKLRWQFTLEVLSFKGDRLELRYTPQERIYEVEGKPPTNIGPGVMSTGVPEEVKVLSALTNVPLDFVINMETLAVDMPKYAEARARISKVLAAVAQADPVFRGDMVGQKRLLENMEREYTKPAVITHLTRDFLPLLRPYGHELEPGKPVNTKLMLPSPFGGSTSAEAAGQLVMQPSKDRRNYPLRYDLKFELAAVNALLTDMVARKSGKSADAIAKDVEKINMLISSQVTFLFDSQTGWMTQSDQTLTWTLEKRTANDHRSWRPAPAKKEDEKEKK